MRPLIKAGLLATLLLTSAAWAQTTSPVGLWKTIDDTLYGVDTNFSQGSTSVEFWDEGGKNPDIEVTELTDVSAQRAYIAALPEGVQNLVVHLYFRFLDQFIQRR